MSKSLDKFDAYRPPVTKKMVRLFTNVAKALIDIEQHFGEDGLPYISDEETLKKASEEVGKELIRKTLISGDIKGIVRSAIVKYGEYAEEEE